MRVGWLADDPGYQGGAELTQEGFRLAAIPRGIEVVDCPPGLVHAGLDRYVVHNCVSYSPLDLKPIGDTPTFKYIHDMWPHGDQSVRGHLLSKARCVFTSPLHRDWFPYSAPVRESYLIPPALDLETFRRHGEPVEVQRFQDAEPSLLNPREGTCWLGSLNNPGKGVHLAMEWAEENGPVDFYGEGPYRPLDSEHVRYKGAVKPEDVAATLARYENFVFLPTHWEPFGRAVVEAWASGCNLVLNGNVGARHWIEEEPTALFAAAESFWDLVTA